MGAWGPGNFENDAALDWLADLVESDDSALVSEALRQITEASSDLRLRTNDCCDALAAAETVAACQGRRAADLPEELVHWVDSHSRDFDTRQLALAEQAVRRIEERSELQELFDEGEPNLDWHRVVRELIARLSQQHA